MTGARVARARIAVVLLIGAVVVATSAGIAGGALTLKKKRAQITLTVGNFGTATAKCKQGTKAVAGGFDGPGRAGGFDDGNYVMPFGSERESKREWSTFGVQYFDGGGDLVTYAYCSDDFPKLKAVRDTTTIVAGDTGSATVSCPPGGEAVSGGFTTDYRGDGANIYTHTSRRQGRREWLVEGFNLLGNATKLTAIAYCAKDRLGLKQKSATANADSGEVASATAKCKRKQRAVSGGFEGTWFDQPGETTEIAESRRKGKRGWEASTSAFTTSPPVPWEAFVYCIDKKEL